MRGTEAKVLETIKQTFWWPKMHLDIKRYVDICNAGKRSKLTDKKPA